MGVEADVRHTDVSTLFCNEECASALFQLAGVTANIKSKIRQIMPPDLGEHERTSPSSRPRLTIRFPLPPPVMTAEWDPQASHQFSDSTLSSQTPTCPLSNPLSKHPPCFSSQSPRPPSPPWRGRVRSIPPPSALHNMRQRPLLSPITSSLTIL